MQIIHALQDWWQHQTWLEIIGVITGLLCVYLAARNNIWNWPVAIVSVGIYIFIFMDARLYADMGLQVYFLVMNIYGWYFWSRKPAVEVKTPVVMITSQQAILSVLVIAVITPVLGFLLIKFAPILHYTPASYPYIDSFCTACSVVAQVFMARKVLQNWLIWIFVDTIYVGVYIFKHLDLTAGMYAIYVGIALMGYIDWKKDYRKQLA
ncbi:nicotinamide riboside transporter PnuC [Mucilaginibacter sp.]|jgi:nicotinamide mononucleotide transporter|uniref:nicotinamide riboside transporter PnuC n=1 Tax=Mucilaginibacter sp. TaxID=1882438 RepID=UPI002B7533CE|nr:nicotinamide riboside transporter PnuC [Mucilaginibacter sp.]HTI60555.1 nicotinamide riboside transporter PnuC [Mucilaginibacter sp.]